ncbi:DUF747-domain-containing protein [Trichodelitschia bisporula]|uniref:DUF747-domain-containing protein n=1 Tax=Trichodelitschia bisporula TaxID=703511 RepID=A0A6G1HLT6_9PEZI|nr:DUF747-domain-containing protein [Trichodelitschia bisporula]
MPATLPLPPLSIPTFLQLELASDRPSPLYIHRSAAADIAYESSAVKFERLLNFLLLPPQLERVLWFGAVACFDAWLYTFTILPLRFLKAVGILVQWWMRNAWKELCDLVDSVASPSKVVHAWPDPLRRKRRHRRTRSTPSLLQSSHKADILKGLLVLISCCIMMRLDPSRMYHNIRGQAAIKLYVIYNVLEVADRLLSAIGQDVLECLCSSETLDRGSDGRSKVIRPFWMFIIALVYNVIHASALLYQVITLNVAVNSYSNALLTLLMSNQFVEIKGTVFKKFEKENLFQLTCADVVERFQLWLMLLIIAMRNIVEVGGLAVLGPSFTPPSTTSDPAAAFTNATRAPLTTASILPKSFTILPRWTGQVLGPFLIVLGSEMLVDWLKHAYINKFNNTRPAIYGRFLDVLAKDYYTHAFADQNLTKRLGLPVIPLACLFIRAAVQTYQMFAAMYVPAPRAPLAGSATSSATTTAAIARFDALVHAVRSGNMWDAGAVWAARIVFFLVVYLLLLGAKLVLGMALLGLARRRYRGMKERERTVYDAAGGRRFGDIGMVEVDEDKRRWIAGEEKKEKRRVVELAGVDRYAMVAKRIW